MRKMEAMVVIMMKIPLVTGLYLCVCVCALGRLGSISYRLLTAILGLAQLAVLNCVSEDHLLLASLMTAKNGSGSSQ